jgi:hypothetical protein
MVLRRMMGPTLETGAVFDALLSVNYCADCDLVSVRAVQEKCDEKGRGAASGHRNVRCRQIGRAPLRLSPSASLGASAKQGRLSRKAREEAHPRLFRVNTQRHPRGPTTPASKALAALAELVGIFEPTSKSHYA